MYPRGSWEAGRAFIRSVECGLGTQRIGKSSQQCRPITTPCAAMHTGKRCWFSGGQSIQHDSGVIRVREIIHCVPEGFTGPENVRRRDWRQIATTLCEQIAAQKSPGYFLCQKPAVPCMWYMRGIDPAHPACAQRNHFTVCEGTRTAIRKILYRYHGRDRTAQRYGLRGYSKPFVK